jgi:hypothetical protein
VVQLLGAGGGAGACGTSLPHATQIRVTRSRRGSEGEVRRSVYDIKPGMGPWDQAALPTVFTFMPKA